MNHGVAEAGLISCDLGRSFGSGCRKLRHPCAATDSLKTSFIKSSCYCEKLCLACSVLRAVKV